MAEVGSKTCHTATPHLLWRVVLRAMLGFAAILLVYLGIVWWWYDRHLVEKILTLLAMPPGLMALALLMGTLVAGFSGQRTAAQMGILLFVFYCGSSNSFTADFLGGQLERNYALVDPTSADDFEAIIVLGGGVKVNAEGNAWLGASGDRLMLAARMYQLGKVRHLIATGSTYKWSGGSSYSQATETIWRQLGIPASAITTIAGLNTSQEMQNLRALFDASHASSNESESESQNRLPFDTSGRVGLLTSATHLPRATRLASAAGFEFEPIAADSQVPLNHPFPLGIVPNSTAINVISLSCKEFLASVVNR